MALIFWIIVTLVLWTIIGANDQADADRRRDANNRRIAKLTADELRGTSQTAHTSGAYVYGVPLETYRYLKLSEEGKAGVPMIYRAIFKAVWRDESIPKEGKHEAALAEIAEILKGAK
jgi:hypothetical protein